MLGTNVTGDIVDKVGDDSHMGDIWLSHWGHMVVIWGSYGRHIGDIWLTYGGHMVVIWGTYGGHMGDVCTYH